MKTILLAISMGIMSLFNPQAADIPGNDPVNDAAEIIAPELSELDLKLRQARLASQEGKIDEALSLFQELEQSDSQRLKWGAISGQVRLYRRQHNFDAARLVTARAQESEPEAAGLMHIWNGDMYLQADDYANAIAEYQMAEEQYGDTVVNEMTMGEVALKQAARAAIQFKYPAEAAQFSRRMAIDYPDSDRPETALARALVYEAMANGDLPIKTLETLQKDEDCIEEAPCVVSGQRRLPSEKLDSTRFQQLDNLGGFYFELNEVDRNILNRLRTMDVQTTAQSLLQSVIPKAQAQTVSYTTCSVEDEPAYDDGFTDPISGIIRGGNDMFMTYPAAASTTTSLYHPGWDLNNASDHVSGDLMNCTNPNDGFYATAAGCVQDASTADWGSATITHNYFPYKGNFDGDYIISQYGHADELDVSVGDSVGAGEEIGSMGGLGSDSDGDGVGDPKFACHLHFEIREYDHPDPYNAGYWNSTILSSQSSTGEYYQDPDSFIDAHEALDWGYWIDEGSSMWSYSGSWTYIDTKGNGNDEGGENDLNYTSTTSSSSASASATLSFTAGKSGTHSLWMFAPWSSSSKSQTVPVTISTSSGTTMLSTTLDFYGGEVEGYGTCDRDPDGDGVWDDFDSTKRCDEWVEIGEVDLTAGTTYSMKLSNNTGSGSNIIIIDDMYILYEDPSAPALYSMASSSDGETECSAPSSGDWSVSSDCTISSTETAPGNVRVEDGVTFTITGTGSLDMDLSTYNITVGDGSRVIIETGGKID